MSFKCVVVTPEQQAVDETVEQAILPAHDGLIGILTDRAPLLVKLGLGPLRLDLPGGRQQHYYVEGGVAQMHDNRLTVLTTSAIPAEQIDAATANAELAEAEARRPTDALTAADRQKQIERTRAKQKLAADVSHHG